MRHRDDSTSRPLAGCQVWLTRPAGQAEALQRALEQLGARVQQAPLFAIEPLATQWLLAHATLQDTHIGAVADKQSFASNNTQYSGCIFISRNAVLHCPESFKAMLGSSGQGRTRDHMQGAAANQDEAAVITVPMPVYAVGPSTARALQPFNITAVTPSMDFSSAGLLQLPALQAVNHQHWLIVRGVGGRETLRETLVARGAQVDYLECYTRQTLLLPNTATALQNEANNNRAANNKTNNSASELNVWVVSSAAGLKVLSEQFTRRDVPLVTSSERMVQQATELGWQNVHQADNATDSGLLAAIQKLVAT